jgi:aspartate aminotransferase
MNAPVAAGQGFRSSRRIADIGVSEILRIMNESAALRRQGRPVIALGEGEPDFDTPDHIKEAAAAAMRRGATKYTTLDGSPELKAAVREKFSRDNGLEFALDEITVGAGTKQVIFNAMMATLDPGDEVIIPAPFFVTYVDIVRICGATPVPVLCAEDNAFRLTAADLERAITPRTRWLMLNSPTNPTGTVYTESDYRPLLDVLLRHPQVWILADDIYEHIVYDDVRFVTLAALEPRLRDRTLTTNGVSKSYAMTGWRIGFAGGPKLLIRAMAVVQSQSTSCPSSISQAAAIAALTGPQEIVRERCEEFRRRRDFVVASLNAIAGVRCFRPHGAFYAYASCEALLGKRSAAGVIASDADFAVHLLRNHEVAVVPGSAFGLGPYFRVSYAAPLDRLQEGMRRIAAACEVLR